MTDPRPTAPAVRPTRIVSIDDDAQVGDLLARRLTSFSFGEDRSTPTVVSTTSIGAFLDELRKAPTDIAIIDLKLDPGSESVVKGKDLIHRVSHEFTCAVVVFTSEPEFADAPDCLNLGADDYINKTSGADIIVWRLQALLRRIDRERQAVARKRMAEGNSFQIGPWRFDVRSRDIVSNSGDVVRLTLSEHELICRLVTNDGNYVALGEYIASVIHRANMEVDAGRRLDNVVYRLRKKLGPSFPLLADRGGGYRLTQIAPASH